MRTRAGGAWAAVVAAIVGSLASAAALGPPRVGAHPGYTRVVLDLPQSPLYRLEPLGAALRLTLPGSVMAPTVAKLPHPELAGYTVEQRGPDAVLTLVTPQGVSHRSGHRATLMGGAGGGTGTRLVLDLSGAYADTSPPPPVPPFSFQKAAGRRFSVVLDAGHGGNDPGAVGFITEKLVTLDVARRVAARLREAGVEVVSTREGDVAFSSDKRTDLQSRAALSNGRTVFVSIHANAIAPAKAASTYGIEVYHYAPADARPFFPAAAAPPAPVAVPALAPPPPVLPAPVTPDIAPSAEPAELEPTELAPLAEPATTLAPAATLMPEVVVAPEPLPLAQVPLPQTPVVAMPVPFLPAPAQPAPSRAELSRALASRVLSQMLGATGAASRGVRTAPFYVIKNAVAPAILVEMGFVTHPVEGLNLRDPNYLERLSYGIGRGVLEFLEHEMAGTD